MLYGVGIEIAQFLLEAVHPSGIDDIGANAALATLIAGHSPT